MRIMQVLGEARDGSGNIAEDYLKMDEYIDGRRARLPNYSVIMARTGARASMLNLTQITACVGQQAVRGGRIHRGYIDRTLPHFKKKELGAKAKGFVHSSYKHGLDPIEFFFQDGVDPAKSDFGKVADLDKIIDEMRIKNPAK